MISRLLAGALLIAACSRQREGADPGVGSPEGVEPPRNPKLGLMVVEGAPRFAAGARPTFPVELGSGWKPGGEPNTLELWRDDESEHVLVTIYRHEAPVSCDRLAAAARQLLETNREGTRRVSTGKHRYRIDPGFLLEGRYEMFAEGADDGSNVRFAIRATTDTQATILVEHYFYGGAPLTRTTLQRVQPPTATGAGCR